MESIYPEEITTFAAVVLYGVPVAVAVLSYLLGCINGAIATSHLFYHDDVRRHGSGNAGLTNFYRNYGAKCAIVVIAFDMLKAVGAVCLGGYFLGHLLGWGVIGKYFGALFCIIGHMFPVFYGFKGGKGILCSGTLLLLLDWRIALVGWGVFVVLWLTTRYVSLGSVAAAISFPITTQLVFHDWGLTALGTCIALLVLWAHRSNIKRLLNGTESNFHFHVNGPKTGEDA